MENNKIVLSTLEEFKNFISENDGTVTYFSSPTCNVCKILKPKLKEMLFKKFPKMIFGYVKTLESQELAAQNQIFAVPTILFHFNGKEFIRKSRNVNLNLLIEELERPYQMLFG